MVKYGSSVLQRNKESKQSIARCLWCDSLTSMGATNALSWTCNLERSDEPVIKP